MKTELISQHQDKRKLADGWRWVKLAEVSTVVRGSSPRPKDDPRYYGGNVPRLMVADVTRDGMYVTPRIDFLTEEGAKLSRPMAKGDVVMVVSGAPGLPGILAVDACIHDGFVGFRDVDQTIVLNSFLFYFLKYANVTTDSQAAGAIFRNLTTDQIKDIEIALPPRSEQERIVAILNEQMEAVERSRIATKAQLEAAKALPAAYLRTVFNSPDAQQWQVKRLGDVGDIGAGITLGRNVDNVNTRSVPYLRVANVKDGYLDLSDVYKTEATEAEIKKCQLKYGDILLTEGGDPDKLGRGTFWEEQISECIHQNHIFRVRFDLSKFSPQFIAAQIGSPYGKAYFLAHAKQTTGIATINRTVLSGFPLMTPPLPEQQHITTTLSEQMAEVERIHKALEEQLDAINKLPAVLLRQAFNGEL